MKRVVNLLKELPPRKYRIAVLCSLGFAVLELWSLHRDNKVKGALHSMVLFGCAFFMVFVPLVIAWILTEKCRKKEKPAAKHDPGDNG